MNFLREHIFAPAGMTSTIPDDPRNPVPGGTAWFSKGLLYKITGKFAKRATAQAIDVSDRLPAGGLLSTVDDMARFAIAFQYGRLVSDSTRELMWTPARTSDGKPTRYGLGFGVGELDGQRKIAHSGSQEKARTLLVLLPERRLGIALMTNSEWAQLGPLGDALLRALAE